MEKALTKIESAQVPSITEKLTIEQVIEHVNLVQNVMKRVMKQGEHYGVIPGTDKPTLLKPGAEKLCLTFRLGPQYEIIDATDKPFISYTVKCTLVHIPTGQFIAEGMGSCNSGEIKYRYRSQGTDRPVPAEYWKTRDPELLGGPQYKTRKKDGQWMIFETIENENPEDLDNTLIKMACKRSLVAATLNATAASDIFTQDMEDMTPEKQENKEKDTTKKSASKKQQEKKQEPSSERPKDTDSAPDKTLDYVAEMAAKKVIGAKADDIRTNLPAMNFGQAKSLLTFVAETDAIEADVWLARVEAVTVTEQEKEKDIPL